MGAETKPPSRVSWTKRISSENVRDALEAVNMPYALRAALTCE